MTPKLEVRGVDYSYHTMEGETKALSDISFHVNSGEFLCIVGPSGCGKSTLLSLLAGLLAPERGEILLDGVSVGKGASGIGYMLQRDHLFEWRTILSNVSLGLEVRRKCDSKHLSRVKELLDSYGLQYFYDAHPSELSGLLLWSRIFCFLMSRFLLWIIRRGFRSVMISVRSSAAERKRRS